MRLKIADLYGYQKELDARIFQMHNITRFDSRRARLLALLVELSEMANETRCFKYWSLRKPSEKAVILEEYGDGIHFLLSLGIDLDDKSGYMESNDGSPDNLIEAILAVYTAINELQNEFTFINYQIAFRAYLDVAILLGFTADEIRTYYLLKNQKNHERQDTNY